MLLGPFNFFHVGLLKDVLSDQGIEHKFLTDPEAQEIITARAVDQQPRSHPTYQSSGDFLYLEIDEQHVPLITETLSKLGAVLNEESKGELDHSDFLCTECDYIAHEPGLCPTHQKPLFEFSDWVKASTEKESRSGKLLMLALVAIAALAFLYFRNK
jgi:hypothetical protein